MDQSATNLPHLKKVSKSTVNLWHLWTHFTGAIVHGRGSEGFLDFLQYPHNLNQFNRATGKAICTNGQLWKRNKNQMVFGFMALLVEQDIFTEVSQ